LRAALLPQPKQSARTPQRATTEHYEKEEVQHMLGGRSFTPALEHGKQSYEEKYDGHHGDTL
jgi:hypothetical protein